jgi:hypothetical protein
MSARTIRGIAMRRMGMPIRTQVAGWLVALTAAGVLSAVGVAPASAATPGPGWSIRSLAHPTNFAPGDTTGNDTYHVVITNAGSRPTDGSPVTITDNLPSEVNVQSISFLWSGLPAAFGGPEADLAGFGLCTTAPHQVQCSLPTGAFGLPPIMPGDILQVIVHVTVASSPPPSVTNEAKVEGGEAPAVSTSVQTPITSTLASFGINDFSMSISGVDGASDAQAGDHPYAVTTNLDFNSVLLLFGQAGVAAPESAKDIVVDLPTGLVGNPTTAPRCPLKDLLGEVICPPNTKIGDVMVFLSNGSTSDVIPGTTSASGVSGIYNLVPEHGYPAEFGFTVLGNPVHMYAGVVRTQAGYVLRVSTPDTPGLDISGDSVSGSELVGASLTFFGDPAQRDGTGASAPFFSNPTDCSASGFTATVHVDSWVHPGRYNADGTPDFNDPNWKSAESTLPSALGCNLLQFEPSISVRPEPENGQADSPTGLTVDLGVPQAPNMPGVVATPDLKKAVVTLPAGMVVSPSAADGLETCSLGQIGMDAGGVPNNSHPTCPDSSRIGTVELETPLLEKPLGGSVYLAAQEANPFKSLLALYVVIDDPTTGVLIKLPGEVSLNEQTGQMTATFDNNPQLPFSNLKLRFKSGSRAPVVTPVACGTYTTTTSLTPWSAPDSGPPATPSDSFQITSGPDGTPCGSRKFSPSLTAGTVSNQAGGFSPFTMTLSRSDADQNLSGISVTMPPGLAGMLSSVPLCGEPQAQAGQCGPASQIGDTSEAAGAGSTPLWLTGAKGGRVYLTGPYKGAPFGLSVVVPTEAGPFNLGNIVVRAAINVDPHTAQVTATSDPLPTILRGIPLDVRTVNVTINRSDFIFNPTNCAPLAVGGRITSTEAVLANVSSRFQAANCAVLPFKPSFRVSTQGSTSRHNGASLDVKVGSSMGQANIAKVHVSLPKALPSRLETLKLACVASVFDANPAACPVASRVGTATAHTPILSNPLTGPAYLVSHGGAAFPDLEIVLQGEGITLILDGKTNIKNGITTSSFDTVPDAPISSFELKLPEGAHSTLSAPGGNLCSQALRMPTAIQGQNGALIKQSTPIEVTGCPYALRIVHRSVKKRTLTLKVSVPQGGKLVATGKGLTRAAKSAKGRQTLTLTLKERRAGKLRTKVLLRFTPAKGKQRKVLRKSITVSFR